MSVKDTDMLQGPVPEQWKPENQDPSVAYTVDEMTGIRTPLVAEDAPKKKGRGKKEEPEAIEPVVEPEPEPVVEPEPEPIVEPEPEVEAIEPAPEPEAEKE